MAASEVERQLSVAGIRAVAIPYDDYHKLLLSELPAKGAGNVSIQAYEAASVRALRQLAKIGAAEAKATLVLRSRLVTRSTTIWQSHASWDGQRRPIPLSGEGPVRVELQGTGPGLSIELLGVRTDGTVALRSFGGISVPYQQDRTTARPSDRQDLFERTSEIADGTAIALAPLLAAKQ